MTNWTNCGSYLDRPVRATRLFSIGECCLDTHLSSSLLLICFDGRCISEGEFLAFLKKVVPLCPLSLIVASDLAAVYFDKMIAYLSRANLQCQIMTNFNDSSDPKFWISEFFQSTWPAEDRFDRWQEYAIVVIGGELFQEQVFSELFRFCQAPEVPS